MSVQAISWAMKQDIPKAAQKLILICLANYADDDGICFPGQERLASDTSMTVRSVHTHVKALEAAGYITRRARRRADSTRTSDEYTLNIHRKEFPVSAEPTGKFASDQPENLRRPHRKNFPGNEPTREPSGEPGASAPTPASRFEEAWALYPAGQGRNCGKPEACRAYLGQVRAGADEADLVEAVRAYVATKPECVTRFDKLMRSEAWREYLPKRASPDDEREAWRIKLAMWARNGRWPSAWGPDPESPLCKAPPDLIAAAQEAAA